MDVVDYEEYGVWYCWVVVWFVVLEVKVKLVINEVCDNFYFCDSCVFVVFWCYGC